MSKRSLKLLVMFHLIRVSMASVTSRFKRNIRGIGGFNRSTAFRAIRAGHIWGECINCVSHFLNLLVNVELNNAESRRLH